jgi:hypothetical protein
MGAVKSFILLIKLLEADEDCFLLQAPQEELNQMVLSDGSIEKTVRLRALCKVEWFGNGQSVVVMPVSTSLSIVSKTDLCLTADALPLHYIVTQRKI